MLTPSASLNPAQLKTYHRAEFSRPGYYTKGDVLVGQWHGRLAEAFGLTGGVHTDHFDRLADGQHPMTGAQLVAHTTARLVHGKMSMAHRAGMDLTFAAPKGVSVTALVGGDERVRHAHIDSVKDALDELERYTQARLGGNHTPETTSVWVAARFEHDSARPVDGYSAPHLHSHVVAFNLTEKLDGTIAPVQNYQWLAKQSLATAIYRRHLTLRLEALGYTVTVGKHREPEIAGYTDEYLAAASPRHKQIVDRLEQDQRHGSAAGQIAAKQTRDAKIVLSPELVQQQHQDMAAAFGDQPRRVVEHARLRVEHGLVRESPVAHYAVTYARERNEEKAARFDEWIIHRDALLRATGSTSFTDVRHAFEQQVTEGRFVEVTQARGVPGRAFSTPEMLDAERSNIAVMRTGQGTRPELAQAALRRDIPTLYPDLNTSQRTAVEQILANRDQVQALQGYAGTLKTTTLMPILDAVTREGYTVQGLAPTTGAVRELSARGIPAITLQQHNAYLEDGHGSTGRRTLYVLDESSLSSTKQVQQFFGGLGEKDRVLLVGDVRQHEAVDAGRPFAQLQEAGIAIARLDTIVRQQDPALRSAVEDLARNRVEAAVAKFSAQGRIHELTHREQRYAAIADTFVEAPMKTLVISPDNDSRVELNAVLHRAMQRQGLVAPKEIARDVLVARQDMTSADRQWASRYQVNDVIRYTKGSEEHGLARHSYARIMSVQSGDRQNSLTVMTASGRSVTYDPKRLSAVTVYQEHERRFSVGDRVQFTAPDQARGIANRQRGTITKISPRQTVVRLDHGSTVTVSAHKAQHLDYGYAMTSYSSQGATVERALLHIDVDHPKALVNNRLAYVGPSRAEYDVQIFTNDESQLARVLSRDHSHESALDLGQTRAQAESLEHALV